MVIGKIGTCLWLRKSKGTTEWTLRGIIFHHYNWQYLTGFVCTIKKEKYFVFELEKLSNGHSMANLFQCFNYSWIVKKWKNYFFDFASGNFFLSVAYLPTRRDETPVQSDR